MSDLTMFDFEDHVVRSMLIDGAPWFVGKDICACLEINKYHDALATLGDDERGTSKTGTLGGNQEMIIINEFGLYSLIFRSRKAEAERFKRWLAHEVLPSIRKTGQYGTDKVATDEKLRIIAETRRVFGLKAAQALWNEIGLPPINIEQNKQAESEQDPILRAIRQFMDECLVEALDNRIKASEVYAAYCAWAKLHKAPRLGQGHFGKIMLGRMGVRRIKSGTSYYWDLAIKEHDALVLN